MTSDIITRREFGAGFAAAMALVIPRARAHQHGEVFASIYIVSYLSLGLPALIAGLLVTPFGLLPVTNGYAIFGVAAAAVGLGTQLIRRAGDRPAEPGRGSDERIVGILQEEADLTQDDVARMR